MALRWDVRRAVAEDAGRAARREVVAAARVLRAASRSPAGTPVPAASKALATAVHEARKSLRRARALVELLRPALGKETATQLTTRLRSARRGLAAARDGTVVVDALRAAWRARAKGDVPRPARKARADLRARLVARRDAELASLDAAAVEAAAAALENVAADLGREERARLAALTAEDLDGAWARGLARLHRRALRATRVALEVPDDARLHAARRRWKELGYVVRWLAPAWPRVIEAWSTEVDELGDLIGNLHDQAVLRSRLAGLVAVTDAELLRDTAAASERHGERLRGLARPALARLAAERTGAFVDRHRAYVAAARAERLAGRAGVADGA